MSILVDLSDTQLTVLETLLARLRAECGVRSAEFEARVSDFLAAGQSLESVNQQLSRLRRRKSLLSRVNLIRVLIDSAVSAFNGDLDALLQELENSAQVRVQGSAHRTTLVVPPKPKFKPVVVTPPKVGHSK